ncbi:MAG: hypothetical protein Q7V17_20520 [Afipia sp.]|nr:hypothetical protein [Afipia sp.]
MAMLISTRIANADANKYLDGKHYSGAGVSQYIKIVNKSKKPMSNVAIATLDFKRDPMWGEVIPVPDIKAGSSRTIDLKKKKLQLIEFKIKWFVDGAKYLHEQSHTTFGHWDYFTVIELTFDDYGYFLSVLRWEPVET